MMFEALEEYVAQCSFHKRMDISFYDSCQNIVFVAYKRHTTSWHTICI